MSRRLVRIATRGSALALAQAGAVARQIEAALGVAAELVPVKTTGDRIQSVSLAKVGGKGLFVKEIEEALLGGRADLAIHSAKDLPGELAPGLVLAAFPERADPRDALVGREPGASLGALRSGARVGTGSLRRRSLLLAARPDLEVRPLRGNVDTRLRKITEDELDAVVLACAGLERLGLGEKIDERIDPVQMLPAVGQGILAVQGREGDPLAGELAALDHGPTRLAIRAERAFLARLGGDCNVPVAAFAILEGSEPQGRRPRSEPQASEVQKVQLRGLVASVDGSRVVDAVVSAPAGDAEAAGRSAADQVLARGAGEILEALRAEAAE